jgi:molybdopterin-dependent oxidoreductase alpha subunit
MLSGQATRIASQYHQVKTGGDLAALAGICKALIDMDSASRATGSPAILDHDFIRNHTQGLDGFIAFVRAQNWEELERQAGLPRAAMQATAASYARSNAAIAVYGMGLTQHREGVETIQMLVNLLLLRGNIGKQGSGICPVRGHSNVQGQRTVGITEKPELVPMERLQAQYGFSPPKEPDYNTVEACEAILAGQIQAFVMLGGNFVRAIPDSERMEKAWRQMRLTVNVATKLNRSHLVHGQVSYLLPVLGRTEFDVQRSGMQHLSIEDTTTSIHGSRGVRPPASPHLISEVRFIAELAKATLNPNPNVPWDDWADDYSLIRRSIAETYPETFYDYERRMWQKGGFLRPVPARERIWKTKTGRANFVTPRGLDEDPDMPAKGRDTLRLMTLRSNDQFNTTIYGYNDRFRGVAGTRMVIFMNPDDINRLGFAEGEEVDIETASNDGVRRVLAGCRVTPYDIPAGCVGAYYPEANVLLPMSHYAECSKTPAAKNIPVRVRRNMAALAVERRPALAADLTVAD